MAAASVTNQPKASRAWKDIYGVSNFHIYHGSLEMMHCKNPDNEIYGDYINHDGWFDFTDNEAKLAYEAYGCDNFHLRRPKNEEDIMFIDFVPWHINDDLFEKVFLYD